MLIGISGKKGSGKSTAAAYISEKYGYKQKMFAGLLKKIASIMLGVPVKKFEDQKFKETLLPKEWGVVEPSVLNAVEPWENVDFIRLMSVREFLQKLGSEAIRDGLHKNAWVNALFSKYKGQDWVVSDVRFKNEFLAIVKRGGVVIRIDREASSDTHPSEIDLDNETFYFTIKNTGSVQELYANIDAIMSQIMARKL